MLSKSQIKFVSSLHSKKVRWAEKLFVAEGEKIVSELLKSSWKTRILYGTKEYFERQIKVNPRDVECVEVTVDELNKISSLTTANHVLAIVEMPTDQLPKTFTEGLQLVLDGINDPGNLGTIIRIADWFGIKSIICSMDTVDCFNSKVVQAAMGSLFRTRLAYMDLLDLFKHNKMQANLRVYGCVLNGKSIYESEMIKDAFLLIGSEAAGINEKLLPAVTDAITIPAYNQAETDSLNAAVAAGIICAEFRRK